MKSEISTKYSYILESVHNNRNELFSVSETDIDFDKFFDTRLYILSLYFEMQITHNNFKKRRTNIIRQFNKKKNIIHKKECESVLKYIFCFDIKNIILEFL